MNLLGFASSSCRADNSVRIRLFIEDFPSPHAPETPFEMGRDCACSMISASVFAMPLKFRISCAVSLSVHIVGVPSLSYFDVLHHTREHGFLLCRLGCFLVVLLLGSCFCSLRFFRVL